MESLTIPDVPLISGDFLSTMKLTLVKEICRKKKTPVQVLEVTLQEEPSVHKAIKKIGRFNAKGCDCWFNILREVSVMNSVSHPHVMKMDWAVRCEDYVAICMPLCPRGHLGRSCVRLSQEQIERCFVQIACALRYLHDKRIVHGDVKPENIFLDSADNAYLGDFGTSYLLQLGQDLVSKWKGSRGFVPPDAMHTGPCAVNPFLAEAYALGATLWAVFFKVKPVGEDLLATVESCSVMPDTYRAILMRLVQKKAELRHSIHALLAFIHVHTDRLRGLIDSL